MVGGGRLDAELTDHLGHERGDPAGRGSGNSRNGTSPKTLLSDAGEEAMRPPRDRNGSFEPKLVPKGERRIEGFNDLVIGLVARAGHDGAGHPGAPGGGLRGRGAGGAGLSKVTDGVLDELRAWQNRPLEAVYPSCTSTSSW